MISNPMLSRIGSNTKLNRIGKVLLVFGMIYLLVSCSQGSSGRTKPTNCNTPGAQITSSKSNESAQSNPLVESSKKTQPQTHKDKNKDFDACSKKWYQTYKKPFNLTPKTPPTDPLEMDEHGQVFATGCYIDPFMEHDKTFWRWLKSSCILFPEICPEVVIIDGKGFKVRSCPPNQLVEHRRYPDLAPVRPAIPRM